MRPLLSIAALQSREVHFLSRKTSFLGDMLADKHGTGQSRTFVMAA
jgi:hypothetical protein